MDFWSEVDVHLDRTKLSPNTLGIQLETPQAAFEWVRDMTRPVPYEGVLRNSRGVLQDRQGNSLDRSLLLLEMLEAQGHSVRMARGTLDDEKVLDALEQAWREPFDAHAGQADEILAVMASAGERLNLDRLPEGTIDQYLRDLAVEESFWSSALEKVHSELERQLGADTLSNAPDSESLREQWRDHWWVEYRHDDQWIALDPALTTSRSGQTLTSAEETLGARYLPGDLVHSIEFRIIAGVREGREFNEHVLLETTVLPHELFVPVVSVAMVPMSNSLLEVINDSAARINAAEGLIDGFLQVEEWLPVIKVGNYVEADKSIFLDGRIRDNPDAFPTGRAMRSATDALGGLLSRGRDGDQPDRQWTSMYVEMTHHQPGRPSETRRLTRFDLDDPHWKEPIQAVYGIADEDLLIFGALGTESQIFLKHFNPSPYWFVDQLISQLLTNENLIVTALTDPRFKPDRNDLEAMAPVSTALMEFLAYRSTEDSIRKLSSVNEIGLIALHQSIMPLDRQRVRFLQTLDLVSHRMAWRGSGGSPSPGGLIDSMNEWRALAGGSDVYSGVSDYHEAAFAGSADWTLLKNERQWKDLVETTDVPAPSVFQQAWEEGRWVLAQPGGTGGAYPVGEYWWDFDPVRGDVLIRDLMGQSSASQVRTLNALQIYSMLGSPLLNYAGLTSGVLFGTWGFGSCMAANMNFGCCAAVGAAGFFLGFHLGKAVGALKVLGGYAAGASFYAGLGFDLATSPANSNNPIPQCPNLWES